MLSCRPIFWFNNSNKNKIMFLKFQKFVYSFICLFYLKLNFCAWVYILKFCHLKIVNGTMDARKWSTKWRNWNISDIFFSLSSIEEQKWSRQPETFAPYMATMLSERAQQENGFLVLRRIFWHWQHSLFRKTFRVCWRSFKHINPQ